MNNLVIKEKPYTMSKIPAKKAAKKKAAKKSPPPAVRGPRGSYKKNDTMNNNSEKETRGHAPEGRVRSKVPPIRRNLVEVEPVKLDLNFDQFDLTKKVFSKVTHLKHDIVLTYAIKEGSTTYALRLGRYFSERNLVYSYIAASFSKEEVDRKVIVIMDSTSTHIRDQNEAFKSDGRSISSRPLVEKILEGFGIEPPRHVNKTLRVGFTVTPVDTGNKDHIVFILTKADEQLTDTNDEDKNDPSVR